MNMQIEQSSLKSDLNDIQQKLEEILIVKEPEHAHLYEAARYAVLGPGKRIRPLLCLTVGRMLGVPHYHSIIPAISLELIHCYSLIHDDLPAMDNDDFRRGRPTLHKVYPEGHAILTGDYLLTYAFEILSEAPHIKNETKLQLINLLAKSSGGEGMVGGQVRDISSDGNKLSLEELTELHHRKTGCLLKASMLFGAILGNAHKDLYYKIEKIGEKMGLAFQISDDVIDVQQSEQKHGKSIPSDLANAKTTYVSLLGIEGAKKAGQQLVHEVEILISSLPYDTDDLKELLQRIFKNLAF